MSVRALQPRRARLLAHESPTLAWALSVLVGALLSPAQVHAAAPDEPEDVQPEPSAEKPKPEALGSISGFIRHSKTKEPLEDAIIVLQCACLPQQLERMSNAEGRYRFTDLPAGNYTVQVLTGTANVSKITQLPAGAKFRANFSLDPRQERPAPHHEPPSPPMWRAPSSVWMPDVYLGRRIPLGDEQRDFTGLIEPTPTALPDAAGLAIAGSSGAESRYLLEGADLTSPAFGTFSVPLVQEFVGELELLESGASAREGGGTGAMVRVQRPRGRNRLRGGLSLRFTPRLLPARAPDRGGEAMQIHHVREHASQAVFRIRGPVVRDKLFFSFGLAPGGERTTLTQSFSTLSETGARQTLAERRHRLGAVGFQYMAGLDWYPSRRQRISATAFGGPRFTRGPQRRVPDGSSLASPNQNLGAAPNLGALPSPSSTLDIAPGIVGDSLGWGLSQFNSVSLGYRGDALVGLPDFDLDLDMGLAYMELVDHDAWRLDDPTLLERPAVYATSAKGRNLTEMLALTGDAGRIAGLEQACSETPGQSCPSSAWMAGGLGESGRSEQRRVEGHLDLKSYFYGLGVHQLAVGGRVAWDSLREQRAYSGRNAPDFLDNCAAGELGGGEYCYDPSAGSYDIDNDIRVDDHRLMLIDADAPETWRSLGYGTIRREQDELSALTDRAGDGVRAAAYDETVSSLNYALYLDETWRPIDQLRITGGVRWELQDIRGALGQRQLFVWDQVAPRVGASFDWTDRGQSSLYTHYGWYYQPIPLQLASQAFGGRVQVERSYDPRDCTGGGFQPVELQPNEWCVDHPLATRGREPLATVPRLKGQFEHQLQVGYQQEVIDDLEIGLRWLHTQLGRAIEDVSPDGGQTMVLANPGEGVDAAALASQRSACTELADQLAGLEDPSDPARGEFARALRRCQGIAEAYAQLDERFGTPTRNYDAWTLHLRRDFAHHWTLLASYTYSRLVGNYDGFVDPQSGAVNFGTSPQFDTPELVRNSFGPLSGSAPHRLTLDGLYLLDLRRFGHLVLGASLHLRSGTPVDVRADASSSAHAGRALVHLLPRGSGGRLEPHYRWNLSLDYSIYLPRDLDLSLGVRVFNVTNARATLRVDEVYSYQSAQPIAGGELEDLRHARVWTSTGPFGRELVQRRPDYGRELALQQPMRAQFELALSF